MNNYENELINNKKQQLSKEFYGKMEETKQNINLFANTNLNEDTSKDVIAYLVVENAKLQQENQQLKEKLNCKEYFSSTMPEDTEFVILTKNNYDRQQKDLALENIQLKKQKDDVVDWLKNNYCYIGEKMSLKPYSDLNDLLRMLGEIDDK